MQKEEQKVHLLWDKFYPDYFEVSDRLDLSMHAQQILGSEESTVVSIIERDINDLTSIFIYTKDRANLFATIVGILDSENINFVDAKLYGMKDGHCMDLITISDGEKKVSENSEKVIKTTSASNVVTRPSVEMEITTIDLSYTVGGATLGISNSEVSNDSYTAGDDTTESIVAISLAF